MVITSGIDKQKILSLEKLWQAWVCLGCSVYYFHILGFHNESVVLERMLYPVIVIVLCFSIRFSVVPCLSPYFLTVNVWFFGIWYMISNFLISAFWFSEVPIFPFSKIYVIIFDVWFYVVPYSIPYFLKVNFQLFGIWSPLYWCLSSEFLMFWFSEVYVVMFDIWFFYFFIFLYLVHLYAIYLFSILCLIFDFKYF